MTEHGPWGLNWDVVPLHPSASSAANARLMAAAPELLRACAAFVGWLDFEATPPDVARDTEEGEAAMGEYWAECARRCREAEALGRAVLSELRQEAGHA